jgi:hypothetical protein
MTILIISCYLPIILIHFNRPAGNRITNGANIADPHIPELDCGSTGVDAAGSEATG